MKAQKFLNNTGVATNSTLDGNAIAAPQSHRSKVFETKKFSVLNIATKQQDKLPQYKTILGHGQGTQLHGSLAKHSEPPGGTNVVNGAVRIGFGSNAGSGVIID